MVSLSACPCKAQAPQLLLACSVLLLPSLPRATENLFYGRSHLRLHLHPATTRPSRDNITVPRPSRFIWRIVQFLS